MMNVVSKTHGKSMFGEYLAPEVIVVAYRSQGILCLSLGSEEHRGFEYDGLEDL